MLYFAFMALGLIFAFLFIKKKRKVLKEEIVKPHAEIKGLCQACEFERKYGKPHNLRPVPDLSIHTCSQVICPKCMGKGLEPCSLCYETRRVSEAIRLEYLPVCGTQFSKLIGKKWEAPVFWTCALKKGHKGECKP